MLCEYGCGQESQFTMISGKKCCSSHYNSCPANRLKNSRAISKAHKEGRVPGWNTLGVKGNRGWAKGKCFAEFGNPGKGAFKNALIKERGYKCECCGLSTWMDKPITLELEHTDGDRKNNTKENLKILCPNCHSQTPTWRRGTSPGWKVKRYSDQEMIEAIQNSDNLGQCLKKLDLRYGSATTIVKCMIKYKIDFKGV